MDRLHYQHSVKQLQHIPGNAGSQTNLPLAGSLIANRKGIPGTLGCIAYAKTEQQYVFLTNYHVLFSADARENDFVWWDQQTTPSVFKQLGRTLYGKIGTVPYQHDYYHVDCAVATISDKNIQALASGLKGKVEMTTAQPGMIVTKIGAATGLTKGIIVDTHYPDNAFINGIAYSAPNQLLIKPMGTTPFSSAGDSGAVIMTEDNKITGLLWGSNAKGEGVAAHIAPVISELDLEICTTPQIQGNWQKMLHKFYSVFK